MSAQPVALTEAHAAVHRRAEEARLSVRLGIWIFLASECVLFGALIGTFWALHGRAGTASRLNVAAAGVATYLLLTSSLTMAAALQAARSGRIRATRLWLAATILLGTGFLGIQVREYIGLAQQGLHLNGSSFAATFYALTGMHGAHVAIGLLWLLGATVNSLRGRLGADNGRALEFVGLYWHFVDMVWMLILPLVYLMPLAR